VAVIYNPDTAPYGNITRVRSKAAARSLAIEPVAIRVSSQADIERAHRLARRCLPGSGLIVVRIYSGEKDNLDGIISLAARHRLRRSIHIVILAAAGGLISYGIDIADLWRRAPIYVDRILNGAKPAELPVQLPTKFRIGGQPQDRQGASGLTIPEIVSAPRRRG